MSLHTAKGGHDDAVRRAPAGRGTWPLRSLCPDPAVQLPQQDHAGRLSGHAYPAAGSRRLVCAGERAKRLRSALGHRRYLGRHAGRNRPHPCGAQRASAAHPDDGARPAPLRRRSHCPRLADRLHRRRRHADGRYRRDAEPARGHVQATGASRPAHRLAQSRASSGGAGAATGQARAAGIVHRHAAQLRGPRHGLRSGRLRRRAAAVGRAAGWFRGSPPDGGAAGGRPLRLRAGGRRDGHGPDAAGEDRARAG